MSGYVNCRIYHEHHEKQTEFHPIPIFNQKYSEIKVKNVAKKIIALVA
jgi:hypothetical protein